MADPGTNQISVTVMLKLLNSAKVKGAIKGITEDVIKSSNAFKGLESKLKILNEDFKRFSQSCEPKNPAPPVIIHTLFLRSILNTPLICYINYFIIS